MAISQETILLLGGFFIVAVAARRLAKQFLRVRLPLITGLLFIGILSGPFVFKLIPHDAKTHLSFINDISLAFIAFAASAELYLKELRSRLNSIKWVTFGQLMVTFLLSTLVIFLLSDIVPLMENMSRGVRLAVSALFGTIFVARSPASAIAVINEMRAKGPFTQTVIGVTVLKDFLVIILFAVVFAVAAAAIKGVEFNLWFLFILLLELLVSFLLGLLLAELLKLILSIRTRKVVKTGCILVSGFATYLLGDLVKEYSFIYLGKEFLIEPLLICIIASFLITNFSKFRFEFIKILGDAGTYVYAAFFTLAGASMSINFLVDIWDLAILFFFIRLISIMVGSFLGGTIAGDPPLFNRISWMGYMTQAGVGLGLATIVASSFPEWGSEFATMVIAVIVMNEFIGPVLFKWSINIVKEGHARAGVPAFDGLRDAIIFGLESQSIALVKQLQDHNWMAKIATFKNVNPEEYPDIQIVKIDSISLEALEKLNAHLSEAIVLMLTDEENLALCELIYEHVGTKDVVVRIDDRNNIDKFYQLGALIVDPSTAIVSLMDHFVRSPQAASLLLGMEKGQDSMDVEVLNFDMQGLPLRELRLPADVIILSIKRRGQMIISHGYTRLRKGDVVTMVGSSKSLEQVALKFGY